MEALPGRSYTPDSTMTLADYSVEKLPWNSNDTHPMWVGDTVYFLSTAITRSTSRLPRRHEKSHATHQSRRLRHERVGWADAIVYEQAGYIHLVDTKTGQARLNIEVPATSPGRGRSSRRWPE